MALLALPLDVLAEVFALLDLDALRDVDALCATARRAVNRRHCRAAPLPPAVPGKGNGGSPRAGEPGPL